MRHEGGLLWLRQQLLFAFHGKHACMCKTWEPSSGAGSKPFSRARQSLLLQSALCSLHCLSGNQLSCLALLLAELHPWAIHTSHPQVGCFSLSIPKPQIEPWLNTKQVTDMSEASSQTPQGFVWFFDFFSFLAAFIQLCLPKVSASVMDQRHHFSSLPVEILPGYIGQDWPFSSHYLSNLTVFTETSISPGFLKKNNPFTPLFSLTWLYSPGIVASLHSLSDVRDNAVDNVLYMIQNFLKPLNLLLWYSSRFVRQILPLHNSNVQ